MTQTRDVKAPVAGPVPTDAGAAAATLLATGVGCTTLGLLVVLAEASEGVSKALTFSLAVGPLSGKTTVAVVVWIIVWWMLHLRLRGRPVPMAPVVRATAVLVTLGLLGTFPPVYLRLAGAG